MVADFKKELLSEDCSPQKLGEYLNDAWNLKKSLASQISNSKIDGYYERALKAGAYGGKLQERRRWIPILASPGREKDRCHK